MKFEWDEKKDILNIEKHNISFNEAQNAFFDAKRILIKDEKHSNEEDRFFCIGDTGKGIATVRFTIRKDIIRIIGAGYWREGKQRYEQENSI